MLSWLPFPHLARTGEGMLRLRPGSFSLLVPAFQWAPATRGPRPDPRVRPRLPLTVGWSTLAPLGVDLTTVQLAEAAPDCVAGILKIPGCEISLFPAMPYAAK